MILLYENLNACVRTLTPASSFSIPHPPARHLDARLGAAVSHHERQCFEEQKTDNMIRCQQCGAEGHFTIICHLRTRKLRPKPWKEPVEEFNAEQERRSLTNALCGCIQLYESLFEAIQWTNFRLISELLMTIISIEIVLEPRKRTRRHFFLRLVEPGDSCVQQRTAF
jgi:hypothetical protein